MSILRELAILIFGVLLPITIADIIIIEMVFALGLSSPEAKLLLAMIVALVIEIPYLIIFFCWFIVK